MVRHAQICSDLFKITEVGPPGYQRDLRELTVPQNIRIRYLRPNSCYSKLFSSKYKMLLSITSSKKMGFFKVKKPKIVLFKIF